MNKFDEYAEELGFLDSDERLMYLIDLAKNATTLPPESYVLIVERLMVVLAKSG